MGLLFCRSNRRERAEKFYELIEIQLTESLARDDTELVAYIPFMYDICYDFMLRLYVRHRNQDPESDQPEKDLKKYTPDNYDIDEKIKEKLFQIWMDELFAQKHRLQKIAVEDTIEKRLYYLLRPHDIRKIALATLPEASKGVSNKKHNTITEESEGQY